MSKKIYLLLYMYALSKLDASQINCQTKLFKTVNKCNNDKTEGSFYMWNITCGIYTKPRNSQELDKYFGVDVHQEEEMSSFDLIL